MAVETEPTLLPFLWRQWLDEDGDGINIVVVSPERQTQYRWVTDYTTRLGSSWIELARHRKRDVIGKVLSAIKSAEPHLAAHRDEVTKLQLIPALPELIEHGDYLGGFPCANDDEPGVAAEHFISGVVEVTGLRLIVLIRLIEDAGGRRSYDIGALGDQA